MVRSYVQWGVSALNDEPLMRVSASAQGAFPWLLIQSALSDGKLSPAAAAMFLRGRGWPDADDVVKELVDNDLLGRDDGVIAGWSKYQPDFVARNGGRATTREGRRLHLTRHADESRVSAVDEDVEPSTPDPQAGWNDPPAQDTVRVERSTRAVASPLLSSPHSETVVAGEGGPGGTGKPPDWDLQDLLYELTRTRPWGKDYGQQAVALGVEYGLAEAEAAIRAVETATPGSKPWDLVKKAGDMLAREQDRAKDRRSREAVKHRAARAAIEEKSDPEAVARIMARTYKEPPNV